MLPSMWLVVGAYSLVEDMARESAFVIPVRAHVNVISENCRALQVVSAPHVSVCCHDRHFVIGQLRSFTE